MRTVCFIDVTLSQSRGLPMLRRPADFLCSKFSGRPNLEVLTKRSSEKGLECSQTRAYLSSTMQTQAIGKPKYSKSVQDFFKRLHKLCSKDSSRCRSYRLARKTPCAGVGGDVRALR